MGKIYSPSPLTSTNGFLGPLNNNLYDIETALDKCLSREGDLPNQMEADLDMNSNDILNTAKVITVDGEVFDFVDVINRITELEENGGGGGGGGGNEGFGCDPITIEGDFTLDDQYNRTMIFSSDIQQIPQEITVSSFFTDVGFQATIVNVGGEAATISLGTGETFVNKSGSSSTTIGPNSFSTLLKTQSDGFMLMEG